MGRMLVLTFFLYSQLLAQGFKFADPKADPWFADDKLIHGLGSYVVCDIVARKYSLKTAAIFTIMGGFLYEIKDGFIRSPKFGRFAGDGASYRDWIWDISGAALYIVRSNISKKKDSKQKSLERLKKLQNDPRW